MLTVERWLALDPHASRLCCDLQGATKKDLHTGDVIFTVADLVARFGCDTTLPADMLVPASTAAGVGFTRQFPVSLAAGDRVGIESEGMGRLTNPEEAV
jgi:2-keto-4-pentenoate hydratase/2-oxohepta-3-ene-1,7-dioic acid hydratase in catechol pathway